MVAIILTIDHDHAAQLTSSSKLFVRFSLPTAITYEMALNDSDLLRQYITDHSDDAFAELVNRHIDLVYSAAIRQANGDAHMAEDITQEVFKNLAAKASALTTHTSLAGWLFVNVRFFASNLRRKEHRRIVREQEAFTMNQILQTVGPSDDWEQLRPVIDETLCELDDEDREAVLLRFFQDCSFPEIGERLGIKDNTARMRLDRALDKLRNALVKRGITSTAVVIAACIKVHAVSAAPPGMARKICAAAVAGAGVGGSTLFTSAIIKLAAGIVVIAGAVLLFHQWQTSHGRAASSVSVATNMAPIVSTTNQSPKNLPAANVEVNSNTVVGPILNLYLDDPNTGKPVANYMVSDRCWSKKGFKKYEFHGDENGWCQITYPSNVTELELTTILDGYADTRLDWHAERGDAIPASYTLHLARAVPIGGRVLDDDGMPVEGAKVGWNHEDDPLAKSGPESHEFGWIEVTTDADGRWQINRIAGDMIRRIYGSARDPEYVDSAMVFAGRDSTIEKALREQSFVFKLGKAATIEGSVVDAEGQPVPNAKVMVGYISEFGRRETTASVTGTFSLSGCPFGTKLLTASAPGFANSTEEINITTNPPLYRIVLTKGNLLKILVQDKSGKPIRRASAWLDTINQGPINSEHFNVKRTQVDFNGKSDSHGNIIWSNAPAGELCFQFSAPGYVRSADYYFKADGEEHVVVLGRGLTVFGTVRDADSGELIPHFKMGIGWPDVNYQTGETNGRWSSIERFWPEFSGGVYSNSLEEAAIGGKENPGYILKFQAEGYGTFISRVIGPDEGRVKLDISLHRETSTQVTVLAPNRQPVTDADVGLISPGAQLRLLPGAFSRNSVGAALLRTDNAGHFNLPSDDTISRLVIACPAGYGETTPEELKQTSTITLQPWGRIEGICLSGGKPAVGREYLLGLDSSKDDDGNLISADFIAFKVTSDEQGKFVMPLVPPGKHCLVRLIREYALTGGAWSHGNKTVVDVQPGTTTSVTLGGQGWTVKAGIEWPGGAAPADLQQVVGAVHTPMPPIPAEIRSNADLFQQYVKTPEYEAQAGSMKSYPFVMNSEGKLVAEDVPPGNYELSAFAMLKAPAENAMQAHLSVTVPSDSPTGELDAGALKFK